MPFSGPHIKAARREHFNSTYFRTTLLPCLKNQKCPVFLALEKILEKIRAQKPHRADISVLEQGLDNEPDYETPSNILPIDELEERLLIIKELEEYWGEDFVDFTQKPRDEYRPFGPMQVASLMLLSMRHLRFTVDEDDFLGNCTRSWIFHGIWKLPAISTWFLTKEWDESAKPDLELLLEVVEDIPDYILVSHEPSTKHYSPAFYEPFTKPTLSDSKDFEPKDLKICHIIPHSFNKTAWETTWLYGSLQHAVPFLGWRSDDLFDLFDRVGVLFAFKCLGVTKPLTGDGEAIATLKLQFHWMPRKVNNEHLTTEQRTVQNWTNQFKTSYGDMARPANGHNIKTGDLFYVRIAEENVAKMEPAFEVQWALARIMAMAGGAGVLAMERALDWFDKNGHFVGESGFPAIDFETEVERAAKAGFEEEEQTPTSKYPTSHDVNISDSDNNTDLSTNRLYPIKEEE